MSGDSDSGISGESEMNKRPQRSRARLLAGAYAVIFRTGQRSTGESTAGTPAASGGDGTDSAER
ncbi:hypothetical protein ACM16X_01610 [Haloarcula japonica]|uniref:hypothetical protein n=1 Tax=Haloarcula japonica TaxID=29282 RepID=UPI0039F6530F